MKKNLRQAAAGALAAALVIGGAAWYLWDHRPMEVPDLGPDEEALYSPKTVLSIEPEGIFSILIDGSSLGQMPVSLLDKGDIREMSDLLNQMEVTRISQEAYVEQPWGYRITIYLRDSRTGGSSALGDWLLNGWGNFFTISGSQVWLDGVLYEMDEELADEIRALARDIQRRQQEEAA